LGGGCGEQRQEGEEDLWRNDDLHFGDLKVFLDASRPEMDFRLKKTSICGNVSRHREENRSDLYLYFDPFSETASNFPLHPNHSILGYLSNSKITRGIGLGG